MRLTGLGKTWGRTAVDVFRQLAACLPIADVLHASRACTARLLFWASSGGMSCLLFGGALFFFVS